MALLSKEQFLRFMAPGMTNVTQSAEPVVDIWDYVGQLAKNKAASVHVHENELVEFVYRTPDNTYDHILLPTETHNIFLVIIVDLVKQEIAGHYVLNLKEEYGIV